MAQFKITRFGFQGNVTGSLEGTASYAKLAANSTNLGGKAANQYASSSHTHSYLPLTGGTITGSLYINGTLGQGGTAQGQAVTASGLYSHAQGAGTKATAIGAHAEGYETNATVQYAHAEGKNTLANGNYAHAGGYLTTASADYQTVVGVLNATHSSALFVVGAGTATDPSQSGTIVRKNAMSVDNAGNVFIYGVGGYVGNNPTVGTNDLASVIGNVETLLAAI